MSGRKPGEKSMYGALSVLSELAALNLFTLLCCIPVLTAGAAVTAMHAVLIKIVRGEEGYIRRMYFEAFKSNFRKATLLWLPFLLIFAAAVADWLIAEAAPSVLPGAMLVAVAAAAILSFLIMQFVFPLQAHFENSVRNTLSNAAILAVANAPKTVLMALAALLPLFLALKFLLALPLALIFGFSAPGYLAAKLYDPVFRKLEQAGSN